MISTLIICDEKIASYCILFVIFRKNNALCYVSTLMLLLPIPIKFILQQK